MSDDQYNEEDWFTQEPQDADEQKPSAPKGLRDHAKRLEAELKKERQERAEERKAFRDKELKQLVADKGLPEKVIGLIGDRDPEEFLTEYGELFGTTEKPPVEEEVQQERQPVVTSEERKQIQEMTNMQPVQTGGSGDELSQINSKLDDIYSADITEGERSRRLREMGAMI
jgi:hypothetical protein